MPFFIFFFSDEEIVPVWQENQNTERDTKINIWRKKKKTKWRKQNQEQEILPWLDEAQPSQEAGYKSVVEKGAMQMTRGG